MKKNVMMRIASFLLVAVLISTSAISGTYAKYVTEATGSDSARVAKWGVEIDPKGDLFLTDYAKTDNTFTEADNTVVSVDTWKVVAPGTSHGLTEIQLSGKPEVATRLTYDATVALNGWVVDGQEYCPIYFTIEGKTYGTDDSGLGFDVTYTTIAELISGVETTIENLSRDFVANTDFATAGVNTPTVTWTWAFETGHDVQDTALGDAAAAGTPAGITVTIKTTVTQID